VYRKGFRLFKLKANGAHGNTSTTSFPNPQFCHQV
jgi:hypothetical protein